MKPLKVLILRFSSIGDIVLTTPVVRALKKQLPEGSQVHYFTKPQNKGLVANNPYIDRVVLLDKPLGELIAQLKQEKYDYVIDLHKNLRTSIIKFRLGAKSFTYKKMAYERWLWINWRINKIENWHVVDRYMEAVKPLGIVNDGLGLDYFIPEKDRLPISWLPDTHQQGFVVYGIGGQHFTKRMPVHKMSELCLKINRPIILLGGKEDQDAAEQVIALVRGKALQHSELPVIHNACGQINLHQSASLIEMAELVFSHDTGVMHIAAALKKKVVAIWGATDPSLGFFPYQTPYTSMLVPNLACRPCTKMGTKNCPKGHFKCMNDMPIAFEWPKA